MDEVNYQYYSDLKKELQNKFHHETPISKYNFITQNINSIEKDSSYSEDESQIQKKNKKQKGNNSFFFTLNSINSNENNINQNEENYINQNEENYSYSIKKTKQKEKNNANEGLEKNNSLKENESDSNSNETNEKKYQSGRWTKEEHEKFIEGILKYGNEWRKVQKIIKTRSSTQARSHAQKFFLKLRKEINIATLSDPDKFLELIVNSSDKSKSNFKLTNEQKEKLMTVMRMNLKTEENSNKSGNEGCNYSNNINEKDESGLDDINEEDDNLAYIKDNKDDEDELNFQKKMSVDIDDVKKKISFCSRKRKSSSDLSFMNNYNKIFNITKETSHKNSIDVTKQNNTIINNLVPKNTAEKNEKIEKNTGNKIVKFNIKNNPNFIINKNISSNKINDMNINNYQKNESNQNQSNKGKFNFIIQNNIINIYTTSCSNENNINMQNNMNNALNNNYNPQYYQNLQNQIPNTTSNRPDQIMQNENIYDKFCVNTIISNKNFFPQLNKPTNQDNNKIENEYEKNDPFNINFNIVSSNLKTKDEYYNNFTNEVNDGGLSLSEWSNNNNNNSNNIYNEN
jgi:SHAQKYF class myb-like DNA-binding protein